MSATPQTLLEWQTAVHAVARSKGWWPESGRCPIELLVLVHAEISEAMEEYRTGNALNIVMYDPGAWNPVDRPVGWAPKPLGCVEYTFPSDGSSDWAVVDRKLDNLWLYDISTENHGPVTRVPIESMRPCFRKPVGFASEIADIVIRLLDFAAGLEIDWIHTKDTTISAALTNAKLEPSDMSVPKKLSVLHNLTSQLSKWFYDDVIDETIPRLLRDNRMSWLHTLLYSVFGWARSWNIDLQDVMEKKHAYNATRSFRHGGKLA